MTIRFLRTFVKDYHKLPDRIQQKVDRRLKHLAQDLRHPGVKARKMVGVGDIWEGRVDGRHRFTFQIEGGKLIMRRVGDHTIYKKP